MKDILIDVAACLQIPVGIIVGCVIGAIFGVVTGAWVMAGYEHPPYVEFGYIYEDRKKAGVIEVVLASFFGMNVGFLVGGFVAGAFVLSEFISTIYVVLLLLIFVTSAVAMGIRRRGSWRW